MTRTAAIDLDPVQHPDGRGTTDRAPAAGRAYVDRSRARPGLLHAGGPAVRAFAAVGWGWGGSCTGLQDDQHSANGR